MLRVADRGEQPLEPNTDFDFIDDSASTVNGLFAALHDSIMC